ncbi:MAG: peptide-methionine (S)-S-oxide reductase MsrA [Anaerolineales bacterium]
MSTTQTTTLAGGCFWCLEAVFDDLQGVLSVESGYSGGQTPNPTYQDVCNGTTGHAEVVRIKFDPALLPFNDLLRVFFSIHDPTSLNRQGADVGTQYRSAIYYHDESQKQAAEEIIAELQAAQLWPNPIVTEVSPLTNYYPAEDYHQEYFANNPNQPYCAAVVAPKVAKFRKQFLERLKK